MFRKMIINKKGTTLLEMVVALALFSTAMLSATEIFLLVIEGQRNAIAAQNLQENMRYSFETMAKELRMAHKDQGGDCNMVNDERIYEADVTNKELYFKNYHDQCVRYYIDNDRLKIDRDLDVAYITPDEIKVSNLKFDVVDDIQNKQSRVTMKMDIENLGGKALYRKNMKIQTTLSSRYYE